MISKKEHNLANWNTLNHHALIKALMIADTPDLMKLLLDDLLTITEIDTLVRRFQTAELIMVGTPYNQIIRSTGMCPKVIARISKSMINKRGGFQVIIKKAHPKGMRYYD